MSKKKFTVSSVWGLRKKLKSWAIVLALVAFMQVRALAAVGSSPASGASYRFVQLQNGQTVEAQAMPGNYRSDQVVARFASDIVTLGYKWDTSKRYIEGDQVLYPDSYSLVAHAFGSSARQKWRLNFDAKYGVIRGGSQNLQNSYTLITSDPLVTEKSSGLWHVEIRAIRYITDGGSKIYGHEKLHFQFAVQAINPDTKAVWTVANPDLQPYIDRFWADGLAIVDFVDLQGYS